MRTTATHNRTGAPRPKRKAASVSVVAADPPATVSGTISREAPVVVEIR